MSREDDSDYELHDGYVKVRDKDRPDDWTVLPMHRIVWIDVFR